MASSSGPQLPPGFRFHPTDEELVVHYLKKKIASLPLPVTIIADIDLYKFDPWELPGKATFGEHEWYFFSPRDRKYPNGARPNRAATSGYWKATGTDKPILTCNGTQKVGVKKALVFYGGKPPKGIKTNWIMHEYRLLQDNNTINNSNPPASASNLSTKKTSLRLDDWVLCRIYKKNNAQRTMDRDCDDSIGDIMMTSHVPKNSSYGVGMVENDESYTMLNGIFNDQNPGSSNNNIVTGKRGPPSYWNEPVAIAATDPSTGGGVFSGKRFQNNDVYISNNTSGGTEGNADGSLVSLLNQYPQNAGFNSSGMLGSTMGADGVFRSQYQLQDMTWNP